MKLAKKASFVSLLFIASLLLLAAVFGMIVAATDTPVEPKGEIDVYLIAGQSNAAGSGTGKGTVDLTQINNVFYYGTADNNVFDEITPVAYGQGISSERSGAEIGIADAVKDNGRQSIIVKYAIGATGIYPSDKDKGTWTPPSYIAAEMIETEGTKIGLLYNNYIETVRNAVAELKEQGYTPVLRGMWWMQGCDESNAWGGASIYDKLLGYLIDDARKDIGEIFECDASNMPFVCGAIHYNPSLGDAPRYIDTINGAQETVKGIKPCVGIVKTEGLERTDYWHLSGEAQQYVGAQFIAALADIGTKQYVAYEKADGVEMSGVGEHAAGSEVTVTFFTLGQYKINKVYMRQYGSEAVDITAALTDGAYTFTMPDAEVFFSVEAEDTAADVIEGYAAVPSYYPESEYPFVTFKQGKFYRAYKSWGDVLHMDNVAYLGSDSGSITLYLRKDYTTVSSDNSQMVYGIDGKLIFDLGGHTILRSGGNLFQMMAKNAEGTTDITVKNGQIASQWGCPFYITTNGSANAGHNFKITAENVRFYLAESHNLSNLVIETGTSGTDFDPVVEAVFNNCTFDLKTNAPSKAITLFNLAEASGYQKTASVTVNGGKIIAGAMDDITVYKVGNGDSFVCGRYEEKYLSLELPSSVAKPTEIFSGGNGIFLEFDAGVTNGDNTVYTLTESNVVVTEYGVIPAEYSNADIYPFVVFYYDHSLGKVVCEGYTHWADVNNGGTSTPYGALVAAKNQAWCQGGATILLRRDYVIQTGTYDNLSHINGTVYLDLNEKTLTTSTASFLVANKKSNHNSTVKINNGTILLNSCLLVLGQADPGVGYVMDVSFENVKIGLAAGNSVTHIIDTFANKLTAGNVVESDLKFTNCEFDFKTNAPAGKITFISLTGDPDCHKTNVVFEGGSVTAGSADGISFLVLDNSERTNAPDSFKFYPYGEAYTTLTLPAAATAPATWFDSEKGEVKFYASSSDGTDTVYELDNLMTPYGEIPAEYADEETYPFILFLDGNFLSAEKYWVYRTDGTDATVQGALITARQQGWKGRVIYILMRRDYQVTDYSTDKWMSHVDCATINIDLNGFTITTGDSALLTDYANYSSARTYTYNVFNGNVLLGKGALLNVFSYSGNSGRTGNINFTDVNVGFAANTNQSTMVLVGNSGYTESLNTWNISFTDCNFDFVTNAPEYVTFIDATATTSNHKANITVNGGGIKVADYSKFAFAKLIENYDTLTFGKYEDSYIALELPGGAAVPEEFFAMGSDTYSFGLTSSTETADLYVLGKDIYIENYGRVPFNYADENVYPFVIWQDGKFISAETHWAANSAGGSQANYGVLTSVRNASKDDGSSKPVYVLMRSDYVHENAAAYVWLGHINVTVNIDLGGNTFTCKQGWRPVFGFSAAYTNRNPIFNISNGEFLLGGNKSVIIDLQTNSKVQNVEFNFTSVKFGYSAGAVECAIVRDGGTSNYNAKITFNNCEFDLVTNAPSGTTPVILDLPGNTDGSGTVTAELNGGKIKASDASGFAIANLTEGKDTLTFRKYDGAYTALTLPKGAAALTEVFNTEDGSNYAFRKISESASDITYTLKDNTFRIVSAFLNLDENINVIYRANVSVEYTAPYMVFEFNGKTYTVEEFFIDENGLHCFAFENIAPQLMGDSISATVYANGGAVSVSKASYSIKEYCEYQLANSAEANVKTLVSDLLVYGEKAQLYMGYNTDALVTEGIAGITASEFTALDESAYKLALDGEKSELAYWSGIGLYLDNDMTVRLTFKAQSVEGLTVEIKVGDEITVVNADEFIGDGKGNYRIYFDGVMATEFDSEVTAVFKLNGEAIGQTLTYSVNSYVYYMQESSDEALSDLVKAICNYGKSASAYAG